MKYFISVAIVFVAVCAPLFTNGAPLFSLFSHHRVARQLTIPREFRNIRFENYLKNPRAVKFQLNCLIYDGPCDAIGKYLKTNIPEWLQTQCESCDEEQKKLAGRLIGFFQRGYPKEWNDAVRKYKGEFASDEVGRFEAELGLPMYVDVPDSGSPGKIDFEGLLEVVEEAKDAFLATKRPIVLTKGGVALTTPRGFNMDEALKKAEALAEKYLPQLKASFGANGKRKPSTTKSPPTTKKTTTTESTTTTTAATTTTTTEANKEELANFVEAETTDPDIDMTTTDATMVE